MKRVETEIMRPRRRVESRGGAEVYKATCADGHIRELNLDELSDFIDSPECDFELADGGTCDAAPKALVPETITMECQYCGSAESFQWDEVDRTCCQCPGGPCEDALLVSGALATREDAATDFYEIPLDAGWKTKRPDYWECVIHFTSAENFVRILKGLKIRASATGYYSVPAVCLTEVPPAWTDGFAERFGPFGFAFFKKDLLAANGAPAINLPPSLIQAGPMPTHLKPFVNKADPSSNFYFLHEREWRVPGDIDLTAHPPMLVLPQNPLQDIGAAISPEEFAAACHKYGVLGHCVTQ